MNKVIGKNAKFLKKSEKLSFKQDSGLAATIYSHPSVEINYSNMHFTFFDRLPPLNDSFIRSLQYITTEKKSKKLLS